MTDIEIKREFAEMREEIARLRQVVATLHRTLMPVIEEAEDWRTYSESARFFGVKPATISNWVKKGGLKTRFSPKRNVTLVSLNELIRYRDAAVSRLDKDMNRKFAERNEKVEQMLDLIRGSDDSL